MYFIFIFQHATSSHLDHAERDEIQDEIQFHHFDEKPQLQLRQVYDEILDYKDYDMIPNP
jgi:hypothetical protein